MTDALYPFLSSALSSAAGDVEALLATVTRSTAEKAREIVALRREVLTLLGPRIVACGAALAEAFAAGGRLFTFGNGGSSTDAAEVAATFLNPPSGPPLPALSLANDVAVVTALSNDVGFEVVFARQLDAFGRAGDIAWGLSTSGGSANVIRAFTSATRRGMLTVGLTGHPGAALPELDFLFTIPSSSVHRIQEAQTTVYHVLWELTIRRMEGRTG